jgi:hypothetical protein
MKSAMRAVARDPICGDDCFPTDQGVKGMVDAVTGPRDQRRDLWIL